MPSTSPQASDGFQRLVPLWQHMTGIYGHRWATSYGHEVSETWVRGLADITNEELAKGLRGCLKRSESSKRAGDDDWPPTLGEFRILCKPTPYPYHNNVPRLPKPITDEEGMKRIEALIAKARRVAKGEKREPGDDDDEVQS